MLFSFKKFSVEIFIFRNFWKKKTVPTVPRQFRQYRNVKQFQVGTGTEKPYRLSTKLVLELKNRSKYRLMLVLERKNSSSSSTNRTDRTGRYEPPCRTLRPMTVHSGPKDRLLLSSTVHFGSNDRPVWLKTVHFCLDRPLSPFWTVYFGPDSSY